VVRRAQLPVPEEVAMFRDRSIKSYIVFPDDTVVPAEDADAQG
jgi:hypothetical protein